MEHPTSCCHPGCLNAVPPWRGMGRKPIYCLDHQRRNRIRPYDPTRCIYLGCTKPLPEWDGEGRRPVYCPEHQERVQAVYAPDALVDYDQLEDDFWSWVATVKIPTKDHGLITIQPWGSQRYFIRELFQSRKNGILQHFVVKGRQTGITEILKLLTVFLMWRFEGLQGLFSIDTPANLEVHRDVIRTIALTTPDGPECDHEGIHPNGLRVNNRDQMVWDNTSRLYLQAAGVRRETKQRLGVARGLAYAVCDEAPIWLTPDVLTFLRSAFSTKHPLSLYIFNGTARGRNAYYDIWRAASDAATQRPMFIGWWLREDYYLEEGSELYGRYWNGTLSPRERKRLNLVEKRYAVQIRPEQWAWRRFYEAETCDGDQRLADQEMPTIPEDAFEASGVSFLTEEIRRRCYRTINAAPTPSVYRFEYGAVIDDMEVCKTIPSHASLTVWEPPKVTHAYVVAAVPAFSTDPDDPTFCASVWEAGRESLVQVAEFSDVDCGMQPFAWVCEYLLASYYAPRKAFILETLGIGAGVLAEMQRLRNGGWGTRRRRDLNTIMGTIDQYVWRRADSLSGVGNAYHWKTTNETYPQIMNRLRDQLANGTVTLRSENCGRELERMRQEGNRFEPEGLDATCHHLVAAALAIESWARQIRPLFERIQGPAQATTVMGRITTSFFDQLNRPRPELPPRILAS